MFVCMNMLYVNMSVSILLPVSPSFHLSFLSFNFFICNHMYLLFTTCLRHVSSFQTSSYIYVSCYKIFIFIEGSLEAKLPTIWTDEKQSREEEERRDRSEKKRSEERRCRCAKRWESRDSLCFSNDLWLRRVEK